jgi:tetratricopeptide (TPR) repeat protein
MLRDNLTTLFRLYVKPVSAFSQILDRGRLWFAVLVSVSVSFVIHAPIPGLGRFSLLWSLVIAVGPAMVLGRALAGYGSFGVLMRSNYLSLIICLLMSWAAAFLPFALLQSWIGGPILLGVCGLYFLVLATLGVRTVFGTGLGGAAGLTALGMAGGVAGIWLFAALGSMLYYLASPLFLYYAYTLLGSDISSLGENLRSHRHLREQLEIATVNPRDADAHYQLGLIYQKRRQYSEAIARFQRALEIDASEADAHYQLGRIAREQGRFEDAIRHLKDAAALDDKLALSDVWRELGAAFFGASRIEEAGAALTKFAARRPYDPEGLVWYGKTLLRLNRPEDAREKFERAIEAVQTMPSNRRAYERKWSRQARTELRALRHHGNK